MLDLRAAGDIPAQEKWIGLVNSKSQGQFRPELRVAFGVAPKDFALAQSLQSEPVATAIPKRSFPALRGNPKDANQSMSSSFHTRSPQVVPELRGVAPPKFSFPVSLNEAGYFQIGADDSSTQDFWAFTITIALASHLHLLLSGGQDEASKLQQGFYFYYSFVGNDIITEKFSSLEDPDFPTERVSIRLKSSLTQLQTFVNELSKLVIYICHETSVLGYVHVPLDSLLTESGNMTFMDKEFHVYDTKQQLPLSPEGNVPTIGMSLGITLEGQSLPPSPTIGARTLPISPTLAPPHLQEAAIPLPRHGKQTTKQQPEQYQSNPTSILPSDTLAWHQFRFSIDLRSIKDFQMSANIFCKYSYSPFGTSSPVLTQPPLEIIKSPRQPAGPNPSKSESIFSHSFCAFEFVMATLTLETYLQGVPLDVEIWSKDKFSKDVMVGMATLNLALVLESPLRSEEFQGSKALLRTWDGYVLIEDRRDGKAMKKLGEMRVVLALEDFGSLEAQGVSSAEDLTKLVAQSSAEERLAAVESRPMAGMVGAGSEAVEEKKHKNGTHLVDVSTAQPNHDCDSSGMTSIHETAEYKIAIELEVWKQNEELKFREELRLKEQELLKHLGDEFGKRESSRESTLVAKLDQLKKMHEQMAKLVAELEVRERKLLRAQEDLDRKTSDLQRDHESNLSETRDAARRLHEEFNHKMQLEKAKLEAADRLNLKTASDRDAWEIKCKTLETEYREFRRAQDTGADKVPEKLIIKAEMQDILRSKATLEKKLEMALKSKKYWKDEFQKLIEQSEVRKTELELEFKTKINEEKAKMERMRKDMAARDEAVITEDEIQVLEDIKKELEGLRMSAFEKASRQSASKPNHAVSAGPVEYHVDDIGTDDISFDIIEALRSSVHDTTSKPQQSFPSIKPPLPPPSQRYASAAATTTSSDPKHSISYHWHELGVQWQDLQRLNVDMKMEVERLMSERDGLLDTKVYVREDKLIRDLEKRVKDLVFSS